MARTLYLDIVLLTLSRRRPLSYRNQSIDLLCKSMDWFLYDNGLRLERIKSFSHYQLTGAYYMQETHIQNLVKHMDTTDTTLMFSQVSITQMSTFLNIMILIHIFFVESFSRLHVSFQQCLVEMNGRSVLSPSFNTEVVTGGVL